MNKLANALNADHEERKIFLTNRRRIFVLMYKGMPVIKIAKAIDRPSGYVGEMILGMFRRINYGLAQSITGHMDCQPGIGKIAKANKLIENRKKFY